MNKKEIVIYTSLFVLISFSLFSIPFVESYKPGDNSTVNVSVNLKQPFVRVDISPNAIPLGEITVGYNTNSSNVTFVNKGTLDATVTPVLETGANNIFNYLEFNKASCSTTSSSGWNNVSYYANVNNTFFGVLSKSSIYKGTGDQGSVCVRLGLDNYVGDEIASDIDLSTNLIFWAMPA